MKYLEIFLPFLAFICVGCTSTVPTVTRINGESIVQTQRKFVGIPVWTSEKTVKTHEQEMEDLELDRERREQDLDLKAEERQSAMAFWFGTCCLGAALGCVLFGYISSGWKFWGGLALICAGLGTLSWSFEHLIPHLKWGGYVVVGAAILWTMWKLKDFSGLEWLKNRKKKKTPGTSPDAI